MLSDLSGPVDSADPQAYYIYLQWDWLSIIVDINVCPSPCYEKARVIILHYSHSAPAITITLHTLLNFLYGVYTFFIEDITPSPLRQPPLPHPPWSLEQPHSTAS